MKKMKEYLKTTICIFLIILILPIYVKAEMPGLEEGVNQVDLFREKSEKIIPKIKTFINKIFKRDKIPKGEMPGLEEGINNVDLLREKGKGKISKIRAFFNRIFKRV